MDKINSIIFHLLFFVLFQQANISYGQVDTVHFEFMIFDSPLVLNKVYLHENGIDSFHISKCKVYLSNIEIANKKGAKHPVTKTHLLLDASNPESQKLKMPIIDSVSHISFFIGVDSLTNMAGAQGDDLDPVHGMYWAWNSGYINFKLEGASSISTGRKNQFQYHIGGFLNPNQTIQHVKIDLNSFSKIAIQLDVTKLIQESALLEENNIMSPSSKAVRYSRRLPTLFSLDNDS